MSQVVDFKSSSEYFDDEKCGLKNNTLRKIDLKEEKFQILLRAWKSKNYPLIRINKAGFSDKAKTIEDDCLYSFMRRIQHIAVFEDWMIITWTHNEVKE